LKLDSIQNRVVRHIFPILIMTLTILVAYPGWISSSFYGLDDLSHLNIPQRMFAAYAWRSGHIPLWNPFNFAGQPFWAAGQAGPLYLPNLLYVFLPVERATRLLYLLHELFAAYSMYGLIYYLDKRRIGAVVGAVSFATCGFLIGHQVHTQMFDAFCWFPLLFYLFLRIIDSPSFQKTAVFAFCLAGEIYAGHPQITFYICVSLSLYAFLYFIFNRKIPQKMKKLCYIATGIIFGLGLSAVSWIPTLHLTLYSNRENASGQFLLGGSMPLQGLLQWLDPYLAGGGIANESFSLSAITSLLGATVFWEFLCYTGFIAFAAAITGAIKLWKTNLTVRFFAILWIFATMLSLGANTLFANFLIHMPGFNLFRIPARYIGIADFSIAVLCGFGINQLTHTLKQRTLYLFLGILACFTCFISLIPQMLQVYPTGIHYYLWPILISSLIIIFAFQYKRNQLRWLVYSIPAMAILDCVAAAYSISAFPLTKTASYLHPTKAETYLIRHMQKDYPFTRALAMPDTPLSHDASSAFNIPTIDGYDSLIPKWYVNQVNLIWDTSTLNQQTNQLLDELSVKYIVTKTGNTSYPIQSLPLVQNVENQHQTWIPIFIDTQETVWENPDTVHAAWVINNDGLTIPGKNGGIRLTSWQLNQSTWSIDSNEPGTAVISQMYDPGWTALLDGKPVKVQQVNKILTGIRINKAGVHVLSLRYQPETFWISVWITCGTFVLLIFLSFWRRRPI
jgi:uncharacterized membrane protein YfhO